MFLHNVVMPLLRHPRPFRTIKEFARFARQWKKYKKTSSEVVKMKDWYPCLDDATIFTVFDPHYFYQSAWLASKLSEHGTKKHFDIGSQINLIAPLTGFMSIEYVDIRPLQAKLENLVSTGGSILSLPFESQSIRSLSSLHVVEHIGLGRYGDQLDSQGTRKACRELQRVLAKGGNLYITVPIGIERVQFNAHRIFNPFTIVNLMNELDIVEFGCVSDDGEYKPVCPIQDCEKYFYGLGLFHFRRNA